MDEKLNAYFEVLEYQRSLAESDLSTYKSFIRYKHLFYEAKDISDKRRDVYEALMHYYNVLNIQEEILDDSDFITTVRARDKVLYMLEQERKHALEDAGYSADEIKIIEEWIIKPNPISL